MWPAPVRRANTGAGLMPCRTARNPINLKRCISKNDEKPGENEADRMRLFWKNIRTILERRRMRLQDKESGEDVSLPFMLVVVDVRTPAPDGRACMTWKVKPPFPPF